MSIAAVFPGQGTQFVGMGKSLFEQFAAARAVFEEVDEALGEHLSHIIFAGPAETLMQTEYTQPALMAVSMAIVRTLAAEGCPIANHVSYIAGHSLGEYTALAAVGAFSVSDTAKLLRQRGRAMQQAVPLGVGAMIALLGATLEEAQDIAKQAAAGEVCDIANDNAPGQVVLSGHATAIARAVTLAAELGKRAIPLTVSAPFHSALMLPAQAVMEQALAEVSMQLCQPPLIANITAAPVTAPVEIKRLLVSQVSGQVRWRESMLKLQELGVTKVVEIGAGKVLAGMLKRIAPDITTTSIHEDIAAGIAALTNN
jgi:[acyl-carrier-protein] S-malonyltransferase